MGNLLSNSSGNTAMTPKLSEGRAIFARESIILLHSVSPYMALLRVLKRNAVSAENCLDP